AWRKYGPNWVEFDAPRHLYLHSVQSLKLLAAASGLEVFAVDYDSTAFEFYGSEMYSRNILLTHPESPWINPQSTLFSAAEMENFRNLARRVNEDREGGRAQFFLRMASA